MPKLSDKAKSNKAKYDVRYVHDHITRKLISFNFENEDDMEMLDWLNQQENITRYIKDLVLQDMRRAGK